MMPKKREHKTTANPCVSFRLDQDQAQCLNRKAAENNRSHSLEAKSLVTSALQAEDNVDHKLEMLRAQVTDLREEVVDLLETIRSDLLTAIPVLLSKAGHITPEQAQQWVKQTLLDD